MHVQGKDDELRRLRAAEESALPAAEDDQLAASFEGTVRLTIEDGRSIILTPDQVRHFHLRLHFRCNGQDLASMITGCSA